MRLLRQALWTATARCCYSSSIKKNSLPSRAGGGSALLLLLRRRRQGGLLHHHHLARGRTNYSTTTNQPLRLLSSSVVRRRHDYHYPIIHHDRCFSIMPAAAALRRPSVYYPSLSRFLPPTHQKKSSPVNTRTATSVTSLQNRNNQCNPAFAPPPVAATDVPQPPTPRQLRQHFNRTAVPLLGFGFMDVTILVQTGNAIDCTLGVYLGLSTLAAAAYGSILSNCSSVVFGGIVERTLHRLGRLPSPRLSHAQKRLPAVQRTTLAASLLGMLVGCLLGLVNLLLIDTGKSVRLKEEQQQKQQQQQQDGYQIVASNHIRRDATVITVKGPDRDGLLAALLDALWRENISLLELSAHPASIDKDFVDDTLVVQTTTTTTAGGGSSSSPGHHHHRALPEDDLERIQQVLLEATAQSNRRRASLLLQQQQQQQHPALQQAAAETTATSVPPTTATTTSSSRKQHSRDPEEDDESKIDDDDDDNNDNDNNKVANSNNNNHHSYHHHNGQPQTI